MPKTDYVPKRDGDLDAYEQNFVNKLTTHATTLALDPAEVTAIKNTINNHRFSFANVISKRAESKSLNEENVVRKIAAVNEVRRAAKLIKSLKTYTNTIGDDLQIIGPDKPAIDITQLKPVLSVKMNGNEVKLRFKREEADGIKIFSKRGSETEFTFLAISTQSPFDDNRPKMESSRPEQREYYAVFFEDTNDLGNKSDIVRATVP
ncbi:MAG: hypothetical protein IPL53_15140 [Ignavibacteria bacterium]|nr:hypothetical protein [Ignavibacteria bacterium]